jgi:hypothetical protein
MIDVRRIRRIVATAILLPLAFFRHSRSLWMSLDYAVNPADDPPHRGVGGRS